MALSHGMDVGEVRNLATKLDGQSSEVEKVVTTVDGLISGMSAIWVGKDATDFAGWWNDQHKPALKKLQSHLAGLARAARHNAQEQEDVSRR